MSKSKRLLIIEDNEADIASYKRMLSTQRTLFDHIDVCQTLEAAHHYFKSNTPTCCLIDYALPDGHSTLFLKTLIKENGLLACPIVAITGHGNEKLAVDFMKSGIQSYLVKSKFNADELLRTLESAIQSYTMQNEVHFLARHDPLTRLLNRATFMDRLHCEMERIDRYKTKQLYLAYLDLDHFKAINDTFGHDIGDLVLQIIAERLKNCLRTTDSAARLGGDEFAIMLPLTHAREGQLVIQKLSQTLSEPITFDTQSVHTSVSIGISQYPNKGTSKDVTKSKREDSYRCTPTELVKQADRALYEAKKKGRNCYIKFDSLDHTAWRRHSELLSILPRALEQDALCIAYQPIIAADSTHCARIEALLRFSHNGYSYPPLDVMNAIQNLGLQEPFHRWLFAKTVQQLKKWRQYQTNLKMAINIPANICHNRNIFEYLIEEIESSGLEPESVIIEITETYFMRREAQALKSLQRLSDYGIQIAIDDFGTGYSSMSYLAVMPCQTLKIDQKFLAEIKSLKYRNIIESTIHLGHRLGFSVTAEGIETKEQIDYMRSMGCDHLQGFAIGSPVIANEKTDWKTFCQIACKNAPIACSLQH